MSKDRKPDDTETSTASADFSEWQKRHPEVSSNLPPPVRPDEPKEKDDHGRKP